MLDINTVYEREKQIDRACAAQSPEMLPKTKEALDKIALAKERMKAEKAQYKVPATSWHFDRTF